VLLRQVVASSWSRLWNDYRSMAYHSLGLSTVPNQQAKVEGHYLVVLRSMVAQKPLVKDQDDLKEPDPDQEELHILVHMVNIVDHLCHLEQAHKLLEEVPHNQEEGCHNQEEDCHSLVVDCHIQVVRRILGVHHTLEVRHTLEVHQDSQEVVRHILLVVHQDSLVVVRHNLDVHQDTQAVALRSLEVLHNLEEVLHILGVHRTLEVGLDLLVLAQVVRHVYRSYLLHVHVRHVRHAGKFDCPLLFHPELLLGLSVSMPQP